MPAVPALTTLAALTTACALVVFAAGSAKAAQAAAGVPPAAAPAQAATAAAASASGEHTAPAAGGVLRLVSIVPLERPSMVAERALLDLAFARARNCTTRWSSTRPSARSSACARAASTAT
jgi:hypothetical protein